MQIWSRGHTLLVENSQTTSLTTEVFWRLARICLIRFSSTCFYFSSTLFNESSHYIPVHKDFLNIHSWICFIRIVQKKAGGCDCIILNKGNSESPVFINKSSTTSQSALRNNDQISLQDKFFKVFIFCNTSESNQKIYPVELRNKYLVLCELGSGGFAKVMLAVTHEKHEKCAIKILNKDIKIVGKYLKREEDILRKVRHNCVIPLYEVKESQNSIYLVMGFANAGELPKDRLPETVSLVKELYPYLKIWL